MSAESFDVTIPGAPIGKGRPRATMAGGHARMYTPAKTRRWEMGAAAFMAERYDGAVMDGPLSLEVWALFPRPKRLDCAHKRQPCSCPCGWAGRQPHTSKPDADNVAKAVCDALEAAGIVANDATICTLTVMKLYTEHDKPPRLRLLLRTADD